MFHILPHKIRPTSGNLTFERTSPQHQFVTPFLGDKKDRLFVAEYSDHLGERFLDIYAPSQRQATEMLFNFCPRAQLLWISDINDKGW